MLNFIAIDLRNMEGIPEELKEMLFKDLHSNPTRPSSVS